MAIRPTFDLENASGHAITFGVDEVGRGPLAGPVVAAAVYIPLEKRGHPVWSSVRDSKALSAARRDVLFNIIQEQSVFGIGMASVDEIDQINILQATFVAMRRAIETCAIEPGHILIDGNRLPKNWSWSCSSVIKGDAHSISIAAASIIAKVTRDRLMEKIGADYPAYGWADNAGYGTPAHIGALETMGVTPHHRKSFEPIKSLILAKTA